MTLFGALSSGVSGLTAQSSAIGAISDNITNVSTVGYKNTQVDFQTLVTKQTSATFFSAGGVQSKPRQDTGVQGLLASSASSTDIAISGNGFFVVNEAASPTINNEFLFTRAGSFFQDNEGFLRNTAGFYLQAWPTDAAGTVIPANKNLTVPNQNVISTDFLSTVNLNRVGGTASATSTIAIGANLPSNDTSGTTRKTDVQFFDTLGNATTMSLVNTKSIRDNQWDISIPPPPGTNVITLEDSAGLNYDSQGQLEFQSRPADGTSVTINGLVYTIDNDASITDAVKQVDTITFAGAAADVGDEQYTVTINSGGAGAVVVTQTYAIGDTVTEMASKMAAAINSNTSLNSLVYADNAAGVLTVTSRIPGRSFTLAVAEVADTGGDTTLTDNGTSTANAGTTGIIRVNTGSNTTVAQDVSTLLTAIKANDTDFDTTNNRVKLDPGNSTTLLFLEDGTETITVDPSGLLTSAGAPAAKQSTSFTVKKVNSKYAETAQFRFKGVPADGDTVIINGITYTFATTENGTSDNDTTIRRDSIALMLADLEASIEANDAKFPAGSTSLRDRGANGAASNNTLVLPVLSSGSYNVKFSAGFTNLPTEPDGTVSYVADTDFAVNAEYGIVFDADGIPTTFNVTKLEILGFANGAADMNDDPNLASKITLDLGTATEANGFTQFGGSFTPVFITQNGSQFGTFAGVTIAADGLVTALFDNGETRPVFKIPVATFVNVNSLGARTGNIWNSTQGSGDPTLRNADNGPAGQVNQSTLEQSTVDIGTEFTKMIVVQRAFSASAKIITTADEMLEELLRTKR
ncbi:MAG: flagellar hook-basal body complex protein [Rhodospirillales bacterium]|nr:flagellar hook-basal body complex protein [Alphaproteobacteria bacterium]MBL6948873.1 flagellar hook-basal body complex protein [Rhodospirillales bacterium]